LKDTKLETPFEIEEYDKTKQLDCVDENDEIEAERFDDFDENEFKWDDKEYEED
jgi:hypothetical protein